MTRYSVSIFDSKTSSWESVALFSNEVSHRAIVNFCHEQLKFQNAEIASIYDLENECVVVEVKRNR